MHKVLILGITRDRGPIAKVFVEGLFDQISGMSESHDFDILIYENDSKDNTVSEFKSAFENKPANVSSAKIVSETINTESFASVATEARIDQIASARNRAMELAGDVSDYDCVVWVDTDYLIHQGVLSALIDDVTMGLSDIVSAYSLHADVQRPNMELFDKWATRLKKSDIWWCCAPIEMLENPVIDVYSTFNGLAAFNPAGFCNEKMFSSESESSVENGTGFDVEWVGVCEKFRNSGFGKIKLNSALLVYHFMDPANILSANLDMLKR